MAEIEKAEQAAASRRRDWTNWLDPWFGDWPRFRRMFTEGAETLHVEEFTDGDEAIVRVEMPGIDPDKDVEIVVSDHTLRLRAERREETKAEEKGGYRSEFRYGSFTRTVSLPAGATEKDVKATYKDGILEVRVPIDRATAEAKKIPIQHA